MSEQHTNGHGEPIEVKAEIIPINTLGTLVKSEIDMQIATAKMYPRSLATFKKRALDMATLDEETAASCFYAIPRDGKTVEGPSVRLAEIVASAWGNLRSGARIIGDDGKFIIAQGVSHDLETNTCMSFEVRRRVTNKKGQRYSDDMVATTGNAACSIALRNSVFKVVPMAYVRDIYARAKQVAIGNAQTLVNKRAEAVAHFGKMGVTPDRVLLMLGKGSLEDVGLDELALLRGLATAIKDGETTIDEVFPRSQPATKTAADTSKSRTDKLAERMAGSQPTQEQQPGEQAPQATEEQPLEAGAIGDLIDAITDKIDRAATMFDLQEAAAMLTRNQREIGDQVHTKLLDLYRAKQQALGGSEKASSKKR